MIIRKTPLMAERTTLGLGGTAIAEVVLESAADLDALSPTLERLGGRPALLGRGSNILARDGELDLTIVTPKAEADPQVDGRLIRARAGVRLPVLLARAAQAGLSGLEGMAGIPGSVGGAVAMNAGSYGTTTGDRLRRIRLWTPSQGLFWKHASDCAFGYRSFDPRLDDSCWMIWEAEFQLAEGDEREVRSAMDDALTRKRATQPVSARSAGCVFKNPEGDSAGRLLDAAGFKGRRLGDMAFSEMHANFLVNLRESGRGRSTDALELIDMGRAAVEDMFGITLELEVEVLP